MFVNSTANQQPKTLHGVEVTVDEWRSASMFGNADPDILPTTFVDDKTCQQLDDGLDNPSTPSASPTTPTPVLDKGKNKENPLTEEDLDDLLDPTSDNIYESLPQHPKLTLHKQQERPKLAIQIPTTPQEQGKANNEPETGVAGSSDKDKTPKPVSDGARIRLATIQQALAAIIKNDNGLLLTATGSSGLIARKSISDKETVETVYELNYERFFETTKKAVDLEQLVRQSIDNPQLYKAFILHENTRHIQEHLEQYVNESTEIANECADLQHRATELVARQQNLRDELMEFSEGLSAAAKKNIDNIPISLLCDQYPQWTRV